VLQAGVLCGWIWSLANQKGGVPKNGDAQAIEQARCRCTVYCSRSPLCLT
jgi:hypothetical protein